MRGILLFISLCVTRTAGSSGSGLGLTSWTDVGQQRESSASPPIPPKWVLPVQGARGGARRTGTVTNEVRCVVEVLKMSCVPPLTSTLLKSRNFGDTEWVPLQRRKVCTREQGLTGSFCRSQPQRPVAFFIYCWSLLSLSRARYRGCRTEGVVSSFVFSRPKRVPRYFGQFFARILVHM